MFAMDRARNCSTGWDGRAAGSRRAFSILQIQIPLSKYLVNRYAQTNRNILICKVFLHIYFFIFPDITTDHVVITKSVFRRGTLSPQDLSLFTIAGSPRGCTFPPSYPPTRYYRYTKGDENGIHRIIHMPNLDQFDVSGENRSHPNGVKGFKMIWKRKI
ncbi:hypothetical protein HDF11_000597 [Tunturiibacter psychrotolerans]